MAKAWAFWLVVLGALALAVLTVSPPRPRAAATPVGDFSAERAMTVVHDIARAPHPIGSAEHDRVRDALTAPATIDVPIGVLAQQHGFVSASHFSRIFREEFGTTPRQWRNNTTPRSDETQGESRLDLSQQIRPEETYG